MNITFDRPWSEFGIEVGGMSVASALENAGLAFNVSVRQGLFKDRYGNPTDANGYNYIVRSDDETVLGQCKGRFTPLQNDVFVDLAQPWIDEGQAVMDTMGVFGAGAKVWMLLKLTEHTIEVTEGDSIEQYLLYVNGHDAGTSIQVGIVPTRVTCANMLPKLGRHMIKLKHTAKASEMLKFFNDSIQKNISENINDYTVAMRRLISSKPGNSDEYYKKVLGLTDSTHAAGILSVVRELAETGRGQSAVAGTWYAAFNAVTEYLNYNVGRGQESRLKSLWFGKNDEISNRALRLALEMAV